MYVNRRHVRDNPLKIRLNDDELAALDLMAQKDQLQIAVLARELLMDELKRRAQLQHEQRAA